MCMLGDTSAAKDTWTPMVPAALFKEASCESTIMSPTDDHIQEMQ